MALRKVTSQLPDPSYVRALEKTIGDMEAQLAAQATAISALEKRPRGLPATAPQTPVAPDALAATSSIDGMGARISTTFQRVNYDTKGRAIVIDRHELQGRVTPGALAPIAGSEAILDQWGSSSRYAVGASSDLTTLVEAAGGVFRVSADGGATWSNIGGAGGDGTPGRYHYDTPAVSSNGTRISVFSQNDNRYYVSLDRGVTWDQRGQAGSSVNSYAASRDGSRVYVAFYYSGGGLSASNDGGETFSSITGPAWSGVWEEITCSADGSKVIISGNGGTWFSTDFGGSWTLGTGINRLYSLSSSDSGAKIAGTDGNGGLYGSFDGGATWSLQATPGLDYSRLATVSGSGSSVILSNYDGPFILSAFPRDEDATWFSLSSCPGDRSDIAYWPLPPGQTWEFRVRAVSDKGVRGAYSTPVTTTLT